jgi:probable rRNA maturation factor
MSTESLPLPTLEFHLHQDGRDVDLGFWSTLAERSLPGILAASVSTEAPLLHLDLVEISLVSDEAIAQVHADFMDDPTPTDVITFHHGEILVSLDTADRQAAEHGEPWEREVFRYIIHGLLHLAGWDDQAEHERSAMHEVQERVIRETYPADGRDDVL